MPTKPLRNLPTLWDGVSRLRVAVLVDVDGTLVGLYRARRRPIRPSAVEALRLLSGHAPVLLWSIAGADNGQRLLREYPALRAFVSGSFDKAECPLDLIDCAYAIDDADVDYAVRRCHHVAVVDSYEDGADSGLLLAAARQVVALITAEPPRLHLVSRNAR